MALANHHTPITTLALARRSVKRGCVTPIVTRATDADATTSSPGAPPVSEVRAESRSAGPGSLGDLGAMATCAIACDEGLTCGSVRPLHFAVQQEKTTRKERVK